MTKSYLTAIYHSNPRAIYREEWIDECLESIRYQTFQDFDVYELDYGGSRQQLFDGGEFATRILPTFADATNFCLQHAKALGYQGVFNVHLDDYYAPERFEKQVVALEAFDLVSSNFYQINEEGDITHTFDLANMDPWEELSKDHNIICNPVVAFSKRWLWGATPFDPRSIPAEDMACWKQNMETMRMTVLDDFLCYKRFHPNEASNSDNR